MRKLFFIICMLAGYCLAAQEPIVINIPVKPVTVADPATIEPSTLQNAFEVVNIDGVHYFKVPLQGWEGSTSIPWVEIPAIYTHFRFHARLEEGTSGVPVESTYTFMKLYTPYWSELGYWREESSVELKEYTFPLSSAGTAGILLVAAQDPASEWQGISGATLYVSKVEAIVEGSETEFHAGDLMTLRNIRDNATATWWEPLSELWPDNVNPLEWKGVTWSNTQPYRVTGLEINYKGVTQTDYSGLAELRTLYCIGNQLPEINVSGLSNLQQLDAGDNMLTNIDLSGLTSLAFLSVYYNQLNSILHTGLENLQYMNLDGNQLTEIDVSQMEKLNHFYIGYNQLAELDITGLTSLKYFNCSGNRLKELPIPDNLLLENADVSNNNFPFSNLIPSGKVNSWYNYNPQNTIFEDYIYMQDSPIDYSSETEIEGIMTTFTWFKNNTLKENETGPTYTPDEDGFYHCEMTNSTFDGLVLKTKSIKVGNPPEFDANDLAILKTIRDNASTDVWEPLATIWANEDHPENWQCVTWSENPPRRVLSLQVNGKGIGQLDVTGLSQLTELNCYDNQMITLEVSGLSNLHTLHAGFNQLTSINLTGLSNLRSLYLDYNQFSSLHLLGLPLLQYLILTGNQLLEVEITGLDNLYYLVLGYNKIRSVNLSELNSLRYLYLNNNLLSELSLSANIQLNFMQLQHNNLPFSQLVLPEKVNQYYYNPQNLIFGEQTIDPGTPIDFSSEAIINSVATIFTWYKNGQLIEGAASASYTPSDEAYYYCVMTNATFPDLVLTTRSIKVGNPPEFDSGDLAILEAIRANASTEVWEPLATIWTDENHPENWQGVTWSENPPRKVVRLNIGNKGIRELDVTALTLLQELYCPDNNMTSLNISGLQNLRYLHAQNNKIAELNLEGLSSLFYIYLTNNQLSELDISDLGELDFLNCSMNKLTSLTKNNSKLINWLNLISNNLPFSKLIPTAEVTTYYYTPQNKVYEKATIDLGTPIENPLEQSVNGVETLFTWFRDGVEIPDAGHSYTYTPTMDGFYHCTMTNAAFPGLELTTNKVKAGDPYVEFDPADLAALLKIRDNMNQWSWLRQQWADEDLTGSWPNVEWTEIEPGKPKRVTLLQIGGENLGLLDISPLTELRHLDCGGNQLKTLELTGLLKLEYLYCSYNELSVLDITDLDALVNLEAYRNNLTSFQVPNLTSLSWVNLGENRIPFSEMTLSGTNYSIIYYPQRDIYLNYQYIAGEPVSYPEEVFVHGNQTYFNWYKNNELVMENDVTGSYMPEEEGWYYCTMKNNAFPWIELKTDPVKVGNPPEFDPVDVAILLAIRDAAPATSRLKTEWADVGNIRNWQGIEWDFAPKKVIHLSLYWADLDALEISGLSKLRSLDTYGNQIAFLKITNMPALHQISAPNNLIEELHLENLPQLSTLYLYNNKLKTLDVSGLTNLWHLECSQNMLTGMILPESLKEEGGLFFTDNHVPFSAMPLRKFHWGFEYIPQGKIFSEATILVKTPIDFSSEALIDGTETMFKWYFNGNLIAGTDNSGIYVPTKPGQFHCEMTNDKFPHLTLTTHTITVITTAPELVCNDIEVLPGLDGTYTLTDGDLLKIIEGTTDLTDAIEELTVVVTPDNFSAWTDESPVAVEVEVTNSYDLSASCQASVTLLKREAVLANTGQITVQYSDNLTLEVLLTDNLTSAPLAMKTVTFSIEGQQITATTDSKGIAAVSFKAGMSPGTWEAAVNFAGDAHYTAAQTRISFAVHQENALLNYNGTEIAATVSANLTANIDLRTAITDISDGSRGDITKAKVKFVNMIGGTSVDISGWLDVAALTDPYTGIVSYPWKVTLSKNQTAETYTIAVVADGYYTAHEEIVLTVYVPSGEFITGGGHVIPDGSAGLYASDEETKTRFGFNVRFNKKGTALQGKLNFIFTSGGKTYQVTSNATESLGVNTDDPTNRWAQFVAKCTMVDITDPGRPLSISGNLTMQVSMAENGETDLDDRIAFTLWSGNILFYSSSWNGVKTSLLPISNGKIVISTSSSTGGRKSAEFAASEDGGNGQMMSVYPNPFSDRVFFDIRLEESAPVTIEIYSVTGSKVSTLFEGYLEAGQQTRIEFVPGNIPSQVLIYKVQTGSEFATGRLVFRK